MQINQFRRPIEISEFIFYELEQVNFPIPEIMYSYLEWNLKEFN